MSKAALVQIYRMRDLWAWLSDWQLAHPHQGPSVRDVKAGMGYRSTSTAASKLLALEATGYITQERDARGQVKNRSVRVVTPLLTAQR